MVDLASHADFKALLRCEGAEGHFAYVAPPFNFNAPGVAKYPPEVTGAFLVEILVPTHRLEFPERSKTSRFRLWSKVCARDRESGNQHRSLCRDRRKQGGDILASIGDS
jgi:hypothetical protein